MSEIIASTTSNTQVVVLLLIIAFVFGLREIGRRAFRWRFPLEVLEGLETDDSFEGDHSLKGQLLSENKRPRVWYSNLKPHDDKVISTLGGRIKLRKRGHISLYRSPKYYERRNAIRFGVVLLLSALIWIAVALTTDKVPLGYGVVGVVIALVTTTLQVIRINRSG